MTKLKIIPPPFPTGKNGSFVSAKRTDNPIQITYLLNPHENNSLYGEVFFAPGSEGPPGHVHGGCQAAVLDEMMGSCAWAHQHPVVARKIDIEFLQMIPIQHTYELQARIDKMEGRKVFVSAQIKLGDTIYAKSHGMFIVLDNEKLLALKKLL